MSLKGYGFPTVQHRQGVQGPVGSKGHHVPTFPSALQAGAVLVGGDEVDIGPAGRPHWEPMAAGSVPGIDAGGGGDSMDILKTQKPQLSLSLPLHVSKCDGAAEVRWEAAPRRPPASLC